MKKQFLILFAFISVLALSQVPQRFNKVIVTGDITSPKFIRTGSNADSVLIGNGSARAISTIKTDTVSLSNRINAKAAGNGTANGTNTGDETLTSIKTKLGAATSVSDGYLRYQDWNTFNGKEPAFSKNTAFNKNFGTTTGTVLEGRTFGTAAGSAITDFAPSSIYPSTGLTAGFIPYKTSSVLANSIIYSNGTSVGIGTTLPTAKFNILDGVDGAAIRLSATQTAYWEMRRNSVTGNLDFTDDGIGTALSISQITGAATFSSTVNSTGFLLNGNNLTSSLTTNNIVKWNGSNFVNAVSGTDYQLPITLTTNGTSGAATFENGVMNVPNYGSGGVYQTQTTVNGSTSGSIMGIMPFRTAAYKRALIYVTGLNGSATYTFPTAFSANSVAVYAGGSGASIVLNLTSITFSSATNANMFIIIEGY